MHDGGPGGRSTPNPWRVRPVLARGHSSLHRLCPLGQTGPGAGRRPLIAPAPAGEAAQNTQHKAVAGVSKEEDEGGLRRAEQWVTMCARSARSHRTAEAQWRGQGTTAAAGQYARPS